MGSSLGSETPLKILELTHILSWVGSKSVLIETSCHLILSNPMRRPSLLSLVIDEETEVRELLFILTSSVKPS